MEVRPGGGTEGGPAPAWRARVRRAARPVGGDRRRARRGDQRGPAPRRLDPAGAATPGVRSSPGQLLESVWEGDAPAGAANSLQAHVGYLRRQLGRGRLVTVGRDVPPRHGRRDGRRDGVRAGGAGGAGRARRAAPERRRQPGPRRAGPVAGPGADRRRRPLVGPGRDRPADRAARSGPRPVAPGVAGDRAVRRRGGGRRAGDRRAPVARGAVAVVDGRSGPSRSDGRGRAGLPAVPHVAGRGGRPGAERRPVRPRRGDHLRGRGSASGAGGRTGAGAAAATDVRAGGSRRRAAPAGRGGASGPASSRWSGPGGVGKTRLALEIAHGRRSTGRTACGSSTWCRSARRPAWRWRCARPWTSRAGRTTPSTSWSGPSPVG